jgi:predicted nucleic acid-binding Zn ribbon protein
MSDDLQKMQKSFEHRRIRRRQPQAIASILSELISRRGLGRLRGQEHLEEAWRKAIGEPGARYTQVGGLRRGVLEILVANSILLQELAGFQKQSLLKRLREALQSEYVRELKFRLDGNM